MNRGDVYEYILGNHRIRVVIVSDRPYNPRRATYLRLLEPAPPGVSTTIVALTAADPGRGAIDATRLRPFDPASLGARIGKLTPTTMHHVDRALRAYLGL